MPYTLVWLTIFFSFPSNCLDRKLLACMCEYVKSASSQYIINFYTLEYNILYIFTRIAKSQINRIKCTLRSVTQGAVNRSANKISLIFLFLVGPSRKCCANFQFPIVSVASVSFNFEAFIFFCRSFGFPRAYRYIFIFFL